MGVAKGQKIRNFNQKTKTTLEKNYDEFHNSLLNFVSNDKPAYRESEVMREIGRQVAKTLSFDSCKLTRINKAQMRIWFNCKDCHKLSERSIREIMTWSFSYKISCPFCKEKDLRIEEAKRLAEETEAARRKRSSYFKRKS